MVGLPGAFRQLYRKYGAVQQQWSSPYRALFNWACEHKRRAIRRGETEPRRARAIFDWLLFRGLGASLGGRLRNVIVFDRDLPTEVRDFLQVSLSVGVLSAFGFPEAGGLVSIQSVPLGVGRVLASAERAAGSAGRQAPVVGNLVGFPLPCNELKLVPVRLGQGEERGGGAPDDASEVEMDSPGGGYPWASAARPKGGRRADSGDCGAGSRGHGASVAELVPQQGRERARSLPSPPFQGRWHEETEGEEGEGEEGEEDARGELYLRGANSFEGYHGKNHLTAQAYEAGRWLKTGYICRWDASGELQVLGKRNQFLEPVAGRFVSAQRLETIYAHRCPLVHQLWIHCEPCVPLVAVVSVGETTRAHVQHERLHRASGSSRATRHSLLLRVLSLPLRVAAGRSGPRVPVLVARGAAPGHEPALSARGEDRTRAAQAAVGRRRSVQAALMGVRACCARRGLSRPGR